MNDYQLPRSGEPPRSGERSYQPPRSGERGYQTSRSGEHCDQQPSSGESSYLPPRSGERGYVGFQPGLLVLAMAGILWATPIQADQQQLPNIVFILADDLGFSDVGCYGGEIDTPNLDRLAAAAAVHSVHNTARCWPTRGALLTGYYAQQIRRDKLPGGRRWRAATGLGGSYRNTCGRSAIAATTAANGTSTARCSTAASIVRWTCATRATTFGQG